MAGLERICTINNDSATRNRNGFRTLGRGHKFTTKYEDTNGNQVTNRPAVCQLPVQDMRENPHPYRRIGGSERYENVYIRDRYFVPGGHTSGAQTQDSWCVYPLYRGFRRKGSLQEAGHLSVSRSSAKLVR